VRKNRELNAQFYSNWLDQYTVARIKEANKARSRLRNLLKTDIKAPPIKDTRLPPKPNSAYIHFIKSRFNQGGVNSTSATESIQALAKEWKGLSDADKKVRATEQDSV